MDRSTSDIPLTPPPPPPPSAAAATTSKKDSKKRNSNHIRRDTIACNNVEQVSKKVGYIVDEFKCCHNNFHGILYAGPLALVFLGRILLFEWTVIIKWDDVVKVTKCTEKHYKENAIRIETTTKGTSDNNRNEKSNGNTSYVFEKFFDCPKALGILVSLHNDSILDISHKIMPTPKFFSRGLRRNNSDPLRISNLFNFDDAPISSMELENSEEFSHLFEKQMNNASSLTTSSTTTSTPQIKKKREFHRGVSDLDRITAISAPAIKMNRQALQRLDSSSTCSDEVQRLHVPEGEDISDTDDHSLQDGIQQNNRQLKNNTMNAKEMREEWTKILNDTSYSEKAVENLVLPCDLDTFIQRFIDDDAEHSLIEFMIENGDSDIQVSKWEDQQDDTNGNRIACKVRTIEYTHPVDAPMAPPTARARKENTYCRYSDYGLIFETKTYVSDVPMTDCFYVADSMRVETIVVGGEKKISVDMLFDIRFVKTTMFQSLISRTTKSEMTKFLTTLASTMSKRFGQTTGVDIVAPLTPKQAIERRPVPVTDKWSQLSSLLLIMVLTIQIWMMWEIRNVKMELRQFIQAELRETHLSQPINNVHSNSNQQQASKVEQTSGADDECASKIEL